MITADKGTKANCERTGAGKGRGQFLLQMLPETPVWHVLAFTINRPNMIESGKMLAVRCVQAFSPHIHNLAYVYR